MSQTNTLLFTTRALNALHGGMVAEGQKARQLTDEKVGCLKMELTKNGQKTFCFRTQRNGNKFYHCIGSYPAISIDEARRTALDKLAQLERGENPSASRQRLKAEPTLSEFFHGQYLEFSKAKLKSWRDNLNRFTFRIEKKWGSRKLSSLTRREIETYHAALLDELKPASCNRVLVLLSGIYAKAVAWEITPRNPCTGIKQHPERNQKTRYLSASEMQIFLAACDAEEDQTVPLLLKGLLLSGLRKSELMDRRWSDVSLAEGIMTIPTTKNQQAHTVLLSDEMKLLLENLPSRGKSDWLFPGRDGTKPLVNADKAFHRILVRAGLEGTGFTIHCCRHTFATQLASENVSLHVISMALNHKTVGMSARYSHVRNDVLRNAANLAGAAFRKASQKEVEEAAASVVS